MRTLGVVAVLYLTIAGSLPAVAHAELVRASPAAGAVLSVAPSEVRLELSEALESSFCRLQVKTESGDSVTAGDVRVEGAMMTVGLKALEAGVYEVKWRAVSVDSHVTEGAYTFTVSTQ